MLIKRPMENRKIMSLGRASLVISLPRNWVISNRLKRGDFLSVDVQRDGSLVVFPGMRRDHELRKAVMYVEPDDDSDSISRMISTYFLNGYSRLEIHSRRIFSTEQITAIRRASSLLYMSVMESEAEKVTMETLIDESKASLTNSIQRMHMICLSMCKDTLKSLRERDLSLARAVIALDEDVDQFSLLMLRLLRNAALDPSLASQLGLEPISLLDYQNVIEAIESVADNAKKVARYVVNLIEGQQWVSERLQGLLVSTGVEAVEAYNRAVYGFLSREISDSNAIIRVRRKIEEEDLRRVRAMILLTEKKNELLICAICSISDNVRSIAECAAEIAESALKATLS